MMKYSFDMEHGVVKSSFDMEQGGLCAAVGGSVGIIVAVCVDKPVIDGGLVGAAASFLGALLLYLVFCLVEKSRP